MIGNEFANTKIFQTLDFKNFAEKVNTDDLTQQ